MLNFLEDYTSDTGHIAVVAHDAGAANHIFAWLQELNLTLCLEGPARELWFSHLQDSKLRTGKKKCFSTGQAIPNSFFGASGLESAISGASIVITGTGWASNLEHNARELALSHGIRTIAVIDHWVNYPERFVRNGVQVLPDEIWVTDSYSAEIASALFPAVRVTQQPNIYLEKVVEEVQSNDTPFPCKATQRVLYVLESIRNSWGDLHKSGEFLALDYFMSEFHRVGIEPDAEFRLRPHPSDPQGKYNEWLKQQSNPRIYLDSSTTLTEALKWSSFVVGCQTYAMVVALACGRTVIFSIPPWAPTCTLPHPDIIHLSRLS